MELKEKQIEQFYSALVVLSIFVLLFTLLIVLNQFNPIF